MCEENRVETQHSLRVHCVGRTVGDGTIGVYFRFQSSCFAHVTSHHMERHHTTCISTHLVKNRVRYTSIRKKLEPRYILHIQCPKRTLLERGINRVTCPPLLPRSSGSCPCRPSAHERNRCTPSCIRPLSWQCWQLHYLYWHQPLGHPAVRQGQGCVRVNILDKTNTGRK